MNRLRKLAHHARLWLGVVSTSSSPKIIWRYHYLQECREVTINEEIDTTPDKQGRWQIRGFIRIRTTALPAYKWIGKSVEVPVACINQKGCGGAVVPSVVNDFCCKFPYIYDANLGYGEAFLYGDTPNEVMVKVQEEFEKTHRCFLNWC